jgi:hypothetical protein
MTSDLLTLLEKENYLTKTNRLVIERFVQRWEVSPFHALLMTELLSESQLANALARSLKLDRLHHLRTLKLAEDTLDIITFRRAREWECIALVADERAGGGLELVFADPTRKDRIDEIKQGLKRDFALSVAERTDIVRAVDELYPLSAQLPSLYGQIAKGCV